jgi:hypothetical protein
VRLVDALQSPDGGWIDTAPTAAPRSVVSHEAAMQVLQALEREPNGISAMGASAATGAGGRRLNWFAGGSPEGQPGVVVVVVLEDGTLGDAWRIGLQALNSLDA